MEVTLAAFQKRYQYKAPADLIGKGGFSDVYKAWDTQDEQFVALKIATASAGEKYDLTQEVKKIKKLKHPNLIEYYDLYEVSTGTKDIHGHNLNYQVAVMEYAEGGTLGDLLKNKLLTHTEAEELAEGIIDGLAYLHANNITHRDLKPANILLTTKNGKRIPKITDFGLAKNTAAGNTASTMLVGTVEYMAPEFFKQAEGETTTAAADVWSIGVILLEALTGIHPFGKTTQGKNNEQIIYNILSADLNPSLQNLRAPFKELITRCLIREPKLRPQTAEELKGFLQNAPNDFSGRTQIIDYKPHAKNVIVPEPKWKKWGKALFDFDVRNGKWRKVLAREFIVFLIIIPLSVILLFASCIKHDYLFFHNQTIEYRVDYLYNWLLSKNSVLAEEHDDDKLYKRGYLLIEKKDVEYKYISESDFKKKGINAAYFAYFNMPKQYKEDWEYWAWNRSFGDTYTFDEFVKDFIEHILWSDYPVFILKIFIIFYPIRFFIVFLILAVKTLGFNVPSLSVRTKKAIKYSSLTLLFFFPVASLLYFFAPSNSSIAFEKESISQQPFTTVSTKYLFITGASFPYSNPSEKPHGIISEILKVDNYDDVIKYKIEDLATRKIEESYGKVYFVIVSDFDNKEEAVKSRNIQNNNKLIKLNITQSEIERIEK